MKIGIIGAGIAGLCALKLSLEEGHQCIILERNDFIGGSWQFADKIGIDEHGLPVTSSMYESLRTNLPKELMKLDDFPYPDEMKHSYLTHEEVLSYIHSYAEAHALWPYIKLSTYVEEITPYLRKRWTVKYRDLITNFEEEREFDSVIICIGKYSVPYIPKFQGLDKFKGSVIHSHDYRKMDPYRNKNVLVIGAGFSGIDIARAIAPVARSILLSHRGHVKLLLKQSDIMEMKPEVQKFRSNSVVFQDGSEYNIDAVIICTGYQNSFPFLSAKCGITIKNNCVSPLYKSIINAEYPTMAFIGITKNIPVFPLVSLQIKFFLAYLRRKFQVSKDAMMDDIKRYEDRSIFLGQSLDHDYSKYHREYMDDLAQTAKVKGIPPVITKMYEYALYEKFQCFNSVYKVINDEQFIWSECLC